ncbi:terminase small subunit [Pedobacter zeae]|uniref:Phage terminase small subunit n=1 Tax=Pedobacter zeae TaxID=1737356 RepID=A0A7W6KAV1_9SPHI|nr:terminase small subunit [Pedobacter zeae]MBB4108344.1 phage terminase small subunit [Pedobacter zeae]GGG93409.1 hypothetical protein GCM10007422_03290 [Pedobacter zeae]
MKQLSSLKLTAKQEIFCFEYVKTFNATAAAIASGYSEKSAYSIGSENLRKPEIQKKIDELTKGKIMLPDEIQKRMTDIARTRLNDFIVPKTTVYIKKIKVGLEELISRLRSEIDFEDDFSLQANIQGKELAKHEKAQEQRRRQIIRYKLELNNNPNAYRIIDGEPELIEVADVNLLKLSREKEQGNIKSLKFTKDGPQIELYAVDAALANLARINAMFIDKHQVDVVSKLEGMTDEQLIMLTDIVMQLYGKPQHIIDDAITMALTKINEDGTEHYE